MTLPDGFDNQVRLFPLPNLVLFPGVVQTLHVFEPRYRTLLSDALAGDELVTMALMSPHAKLGEPVPELLPTVCIGKIVSQTRLEDGRYNVLLLGSHRACIEQELDDDKPYRSAEVRLLTDVNEYAPEDVDALRKQVVELFRDLIKRRGFVDSESLAGMLEGELALGHLTDLICYSCGADPPDQYRVLAEVDVCRRAEILLELLQQQVQRGDRPPSQGFPPNFSLN